MKSNYDGRPAARSLRLRLLVAAIATAATLASCAGNGDDMAKLRRQAEAALARWAEAAAAAGDAQAVVPVGELTGQVGDWEAKVGGNNKPALMGGLVEVAGSLPPDQPPDGDVTWQDGTTARVSLITAEQAVAAIRTSAVAECGDCTALRITGARLTTGPIETSRGPATAPLWEFTIEGTAVKVTHLAIGNRITVEPLPWDPNDRLVGVWIDSAQGAASGRELIVSFVGAPLPGDQSCGEDYTAEGVESDLAVVVIVIRHPHLTLGGCTGAGATRTAAVELAGPIGDRAVLQVYDGTPIRMVLAP